MCEKEISGEAAATGKSVSFGVTAGYDGTGCGSGPSLPY